MPKTRISAAATALPGETLAEIHDGVALALDALDGQRVNRRSIGEAQGYLRSALRRAESIITNQESRA